MAGFKDKDIVQVEFILVGGASPEEVATECASRASEGSPIKIAVRFYDEDGSVRNFVEAFMQEERLYASQIETFVRTGGIQSGIQRWITARRLARSLRRKIKMEEQRVPFALKRLVAVIRSSAPVAIEHSDRSHHMIHGDEVHELLESASRAVSVWFFLFGPNDLLADTQSSKGHLVL